MPQPPAFEPFPKMPREPELIDIACTLKHETDKAWLIDAGEKQPVWIPKSQGEIYAQGGGVIVTMPTWLAKDKGLI